MPDDGAWLLNMAYGFVPEAPSRGGVGNGSSEVGADAKAARLRYKRQVAAAVQACALAGCDGLLIGCAEGLLGCELFGHPSADVAAEVWAEVLLGEGSTPGLASHFRALAFCLGGRTNPRTVLATKAALQSAFLQ
mmetsp:Transcript_8515/g.21145  ORF Transcript_8515/g.21145 Transcript_8515/m.21145 type:complete len:135 (-) Transcript_8515:71-475(-)